MTKRKRTRRVFRASGIRKLLESGGEGLNDDERALLLALAEVDAERLTEKERAALKKLKAQVEDYDTDELTRAVQHMVTAKPKEGAKLEWPELKRKRKSSPKKK